MNKIKDFSAYVPGDYYIANMDALTKVTISKVYVTADGITYETRDGKSIVESHDSQMKMYLSEEDFKSGVAAIRNFTPSGFVFIDLGTCSDKHFKLHVDEEGFIYIKPYIWQGNDAHQISVYPERIIKVYKFRGNRDVSAMIGEEYKELWSTRENAVENNDYVVQDLDGTKTVHKSVYRHAMLTDEQRQLTKELKAAWDKVRNAGIGMFIDNDYEEVHLYNKNAVEIQCEGEGTEIDLTRLECVKLPDVSGYCCLTDEMWTATIKD